MNAAEPCIYCAMGAGTTLDHIPPSCFFDEKPNPPIIAPCCEGCRIADQAHDEFARNLFTSLLNTESEAPGKVAEARDRSYKRAPAKLGKLASITTVTPLGPAFDLNDARIDRFLERVGRAVLWDAYRQGYFAGKCQWKLAPAELDIVFTQTVSGGLKRRYVSMIFAYVASPEYIMLQFYKRLTMALHFKRL